MRGRTNITPRTGPDVIGTDVTNKQVTGSAITAGDFVEFTGDTTVLETLDGPNTYCFSDYVEIDSNTVIYVFWSSSQQFKFFVFKNGIKVSEQVIGSIVSKSNLTSTNTNTRQQFRVTFKNNKVYVGIGYYLGTGTDYNFNSLFIFNYNTSTYELSYDSGVSFPNAFDDVKSASESMYKKYLYAPFIAGDYYFVPVAYVTSSSSNSGYIYLAAYNMQGVFQSSVKSYSTIDFSGKIYGTIFVLDSYIIIGKTSGTDYLKIIDISTLNVETQLVSNSYMFGDGAEIKEKDGLCFLACKQDNARNVYCMVFYILNGQISIITYLQIEDSAPTFTWGCARLSISKTGNRYDIVIFYLMYSSYCYPRLRYLTYEDSTLTMVNYIDYNDGDGNRDFYIMAYIDLSYGFMLLSRSYYNTIQIFNFYKYMFILGNNYLIKAVSLDLVQKYQSRIDGVAKSAGSAGQTITVCIP